MRFSAHAERPLVRHVTLGEAAISSASLLNGNSEHAAVSVRDHIRPPQRKRSIARQSSSLRSCAGLFGDSNPGAMSNKVCAPCEPFRCNRNAARA